MRGSKGLRKEKGTVMVYPVVQSKTWERSLKTEPSKAGAGTEPLGQGCKTESRFPSYQRWAKKEGDVSFI